MKLFESMIARGVLLALFLSVVTEGKSPTVITYIGSVEGSYETANNSRQYEAYEGIPYAEPPVGELRFEPPEPPMDKSNEIPSMVANKLSPVCMQYDEAREEVIGDEDCLYLNIYRPVITGIQDNLLPVIFYIHGNDFQSGSGGEHGPKYLMDRDVILVTFNYRLGAFGFLSTEDDVVPGNMGLKDQVLALRWVKYNIKPFNGDPDNIAIFGHGAGGASVHYHYLTEKTEGLFRKGMSMSGTALAPWAQAKASLEKATELAELVDCGFIESIATMVKCLKNKPADNLVQSKVLKFTRYMKSPFAPFGPVAEKGEHDSSYINELPSDIITASRAKNLPWITGFVDSDGLAVASGFIGNPAELENLDRKWLTIAPDLLEYSDTVPKQDHADVARLIKEHYFGTRAIAPSSTVIILDMIGDRLFATEGAEAASLQAEFGQGSIRFYKFSYRGANSFSDIPNGSPEPYRASHKDDLAYVFDLPVNMSATKEGELMRRQMIDLWISYAADKEHSEPKVDIEWPALDRNSNVIKYLQILGPDNGVIESSSNIGNKRFWGSLGINENRINIAPV